MLLTIILIKGTVLPNLTVVRVTRVFPESWFDLHLHHHTYHTTDVVRKKLAQNLILLRRQRFASESFIEFPLYHGERAFDICPTTIILLKKVVVEMKIVIQRVPHISVVRPRPVVRFKRNKSDTAFIINTLQVKLRQIRLIRHNPFDFETLRSFAY